MYTGLSALDPVVERHLQKRDAALRVVKTFAEVLATIQQPGAVVALMHEALAHLERMQCEHPRHFAMSLSRLANALRRAGHPEQALALLRWAEARELLDQYLVDDLVRCHLALKDLPSVEALVTRIKALRLDPAYALASLAHAYCRNGDEPRMRVCREQALRAGAGSDLTFMMLIDTCGRGDATVATALFNAARVRRAAGAATYAAAAAVYARSGLIEAAAMVFAEARERGLLSTRLCSVMVRTYAAELRLAEATRLLGEAASGGWADARAYAAIIQAHIDASDLKAASEQLRLARESGNADESCFVRLIRAYVRVGHLTKARRLFRQAKATHCAGFGARRELARALWQGRSDATGDSRGGRLG